MKHTLSIVTPAYNEAENLRAFYERLRTVLEDREWEWIIVDDHSVDDTAAVADALAQQDPRVKGVRLARNAGSHAAIRCGLEQASGDGIAVLAADLQDPPEIIPELVARWQNGSDIVWAVRGRREGHGPLNRVVSSLFYAIMRSVVGLKEMPSTGADFFLLDRSVAAALSTFSERNVSMFALLSWIGFRQTAIVYDKQARVHGRSGWTWEKKLKVAIDSVLSFSYLPVRVMSLLGITTAIAGFGYALLVVVNAFRGHPPEGWASLMVVVLVVSGVQMAMLGILGEYLWRSLDEARRRPAFIIERRFGGDAASEVRRSTGGTSADRDISLHGGGASPLGGQ